MEQAAKQILEVAGNGTGGASCDAGSSLASEANRQNRTNLTRLIQELGLLRSEMVALEESALRRPDRVQQEHLSSARNLLHYVALRRHDIRHLQSALSAVGLSSLGRTEPHVLRTLDAVLGILEHLAASAEGAKMFAEGPQTENQGAVLLGRNTVALLGGSPASRGVRIMVTMPPEAAADYKLVRDLLANGMDCMRINCAHDGPAAWAAMIGHLRRAEKECNKACRVAMDLAGPKLRTGPIEPGPAVIKYRPQRNALGRVVAPARIWLTPSRCPEAPPEKADAVLPVAKRWLAELRVGDRVRFTDARGAARSIRVTHSCGESLWAEGVRTAYIVPGMLLEVESKDFERKALHTVVAPLTRPEQTIRLKLGDALILTRTLEPGQPAKYDNLGQVIQPARVGVSLGEFFDGVQLSQTIWLDDGKIGGLIQSVTPNEVTLQITHARPTGEKLGSEKGINAPESNLRLPALTQEDLEALKFAVQNADLVGYSFVRKESDVYELQARLAECGGDRLGVILKIETREAFDQLPKLLLAAMRSRAVGVMIARGDLAVECGYQRLAEVQEEILWICEAAHVPVIWATQVLESLAKNGIPSRSEITDAAMGERAECVMLNKGPYILKAVRTLDDILRRMQAHQEKKRSMLRKLHMADAFQTGS